MHAGSAKKSVKEIQKTKRRKSKSRSKSRGVGKRKPQVMIEEEPVPPSTRIYPVLDEENANNANNDDNFEGTDSQRLIGSTQTDSVTPKPFNVSRTFVSVLPVLVLAIALFMTYGWLTIDSPEQPGVSRKDFGRVLANVVQAYPSISERDKSQLRGAANRWFDTSSNDPVVVVIYSSDPSSSLLDDLVNETGALLDQKTSVVNANANIVRAQLHETLDKTLRGRTKSTIGVRDVEKLKFDAALVLHGFEDGGDYSIHSRPLIWLLVTRDSSISETSCDAAIEKTLLNSWIGSGGTRGNIAPIISRILQFTVCLERE